MPSFFLNKPIPLTLLAHCPHSKPSVKTLFIKEPIQFPAFCSQVLLEKTASRFNLKVQLHPVFP